MSLAMNVTNCKPAVFVVDNRNTKRKLPKSFAESVRCNADFEDKVVLVVDQGNFDTYAVTVAWQDVSADAKQCFQRAAQLGKTLHDVCINTDGSPPFAHGLAETDKESAAVVRFVQQALEEGIACEASVVWSEVALALFVRA